MKRMKTFFIYALLIAAFWIFSNLIIYISVNGTYRDKDTKVYVSSPEIIISESKATYINGYVKGSIKNNTEEIINNKYLKIDMYSARNVNLGTKYIKIDNLQLNATQEFEMWYKFTDVNYVIITTTDDVQNVETDAFLSQKVAFYYLATKLMFLFFVA